MLFEKIIAYFHPKQPVQPIACPNCWGVSQWDGKDCPRYFDLDKGASKEVMSRNGFIRKFVKRFLR